MNNTLLRIDNLHAGYAEPVIRSVTLSLKAGDRMGLSGPNGTGKSTLLRAIVGNAHCFQGNISRPPKGQVAYLAQQYPDNRELSITGRDVLRLLRVNSTELPALVSQLMDIRLDHMSAGQRQLVKAWAILHTHTRLVMLDEPTSSIDETSKELMAGIIANMAPDRCALIVSHDMEFLQVTCNTIMELGA